MGSIDNQHQQREGLIRFRDCFTVDHKARSEEDLSFREIFRSFIFDAGYRVVVYYRISVYFKKARFFKRLARITGSLILMRLCRVPGVEFRTKNEIGAGLFIYHPHDIVLGAGCKIGKKVIIYNGVTLGVRTLEEAIDKNKDVSTCYPVIEDGVIIFPGSKIIGPVTIGKNSVVGTNSVVNKSFPENSVIAGSPARLIGNRK